MLTHFLSSPFPPSNGGHPPPLLSPAAIARFVCPSSNRMISCDCFRFVVMLSMHIALTHGSILTNHVLFAGLLFLYRSPTSPKLSPMSKLAVVIVSALRLVLLAAENILLLTRPPLSPHPPPPSLQASIGARTLLVRLITSWRRNRRLLSINHTGGACRRRVVAVAVRHCPSSRVWQRKWLRQEEVG